MNTQHKIGCKDLGCPGCDAGDPPSVTEPQRCPTCTIGRKDRRGMAYNGPNLPGDKRYRVCADPWHNAAQPGPSPVANTPQPDLPRKLTWAEETMRMINVLTPDIKGKAFDPDWFLLRQRLEEIDAGAARRLSPDPMQSYENKLLADAQRRGMEIAECGHATKYETIGIPGGVGCLLCDIDRLRAALKTQEPASPQAQKGKP